ncbi:DNA helicase [Hahella sp. CR1]|uniref:DNA helicase n=1 Tax=Hahella sp. CR1 TaxID=2992807 RepID=UPI002442CCEB|nr:DNA helicase [Hahella sp. CR1]MDG9669196.1 DNA helicase [Hahella sp. CR1]
MKLTAPVHVLKGKAKALKRAQSLTMTEALDQIARAEGFSSWSLLQSKVKTLTPQTTEELLDYLHPGDLLLIGARPGLGKTTLALQLVLQAIKEGRQCFFFSLEYSKTALIEKLSTLDRQFEPDHPLLKLDMSDEISSDYIVKQTKDWVTEGSLIAVDYLQLLDQNRNKPPLQQQIEELKSYARAKKCILVFISQIDRRFDEDERAIPTIKDVRLPNPLDMGLFNKSVFVRNGQIYT